MKNLFVLTVFLLTQLLQAQTYTMVDLFNRNQRYGERGYYFHDTQGYFNIYKNATWQHTSANMSIQLRFDVKTFVKHNRFKTDALVGGIRIVKSGVEVLNTLYEVQQLKPSDINYVVYNGHRIPNTPDCFGCTIPDQRIRMYYKEPDNDNNAFSFLYFDIHIYYNRQNQPILRIVFTEEALRGMNPGYVDPDFPAPSKTQLFLPFATYDFVKMP